MIPKLLLSILAITLHCTGGFSSCQAQDWPQFRGPNSNGVAETLMHPQEWSGDKNLAWSVEVAGGGWSSPIVTGDKIYLTTAAGPMKPVGFQEGVRNMRSTLPSEPLKFQVICLNLDDGTELWTKTLDEKMPEHGIHPSNSFATESPVTDGEHLFVYYAAIGLVAALDFEGNEVWRKEIGAYPTGNGFGSGSSLAIHEDNVFVQCDNDEESFIVAFNKSNGDEVWKKSRESRTSWSSPLVWKNNERVELIACGSGFVTSYDPSNGDELWTLTDVGSSFSSSPAADSEKIYFGNSGPQSSGPLVAVNSSMTGENAFAADSKLDGITWSRMRAGPGMSSPVSVNGFVYTSSRQFLSCYSAKDGTEVYKTRVPGLGSTAASFWADNERLFIIDENGSTFVIAVGEEFKLLGTNKIDDLFWSTPAVSGKSLLLRGVNKIYCIRE